MDMPNFFRLTDKRNKNIKNKSAFFRIAVSLLIANLLIGQPMSMAKFASEKPGLSKPNEHNKKLNGSASFRQATDGDVCYLLNRLSFGPRPGELQALKAMGIGNYINQQLHPNTIPESPIITAFISSDSDLTATPGELFVNYGPPAIKAVEKAALIMTPDDKKEAQKVVRKEEHQLNKKFAQLHFMRAQYSPKQLQEVMTDFWLNHFNIYGEKGLDRIWVGLYEDKAIRPYALGKFRDLLGATCHHAAMQFYLDNWQNSAPPNTVNINNGQNANAPRGKFSGLNENYARELMELHTLGVDGGYTQQDVIQLAKILTGFGLPPQGKRALTLNIDPIMGICFDEKRHDFSDKILLGHPIKGSGANEVEQALDLLASQAMPPPLTMCVIN